MARRVVGSAGGAASVAIALVVWRGAGGAPRVMSDLCVHRGTALSLGRVSGDEEKGVQQAPPVRLGEIPAESLREHRQRGYEIAGERVGIQVLCRGDCLQRLAEPGGAPEPDQRRGHRWRRAGRRLLAFPGRPEGDYQLHAECLGEPRQRRGRRVAPAVLQVGDIGHGQARVRGNGRHGPPCRSPPCPQLAADGWRFHASP